MLLGAIADDLTGATDLSLTLSREGHEDDAGDRRPGPELDFGDADAVVVGAEVAHHSGGRGGRACRSSAAQTLIAAGAEQLVFKYCSTFDSTDAGNIGPVAEALIDLPRADFTVACPAFPANGRSIYHGHLFVGDALLNESAMTRPSADADARRQPRARAAAPDDAQGRAGRSAERRGGRRRDSRQRSNRRGANGERIVIVDAVRDEHLRAIGEACRG